jgi:hypothetical protein
MKSLDHLRDQILGSSRGDWHVIHPPIYELKVGRVDSRNGSGDVEHWVDIDEHDLLAVYRPDVSLRIAYGIATHDARGWEPEWAHFANPEVNAMYADVFWNGALIDRHVVIEVDSGRALLPDPRDLRVSATEDVFNTEVIAQTVTQSQVKFARLLHSLADRDDFDEYFLRAGFVEVPD